MAAAMKAFFGVILLWKSYERGPYGTGDSLGSRRAAFV